MAISVALDPSNSPAQNKAELQAAVNDSYFIGRGGRAELPRGAIPMAPGVVMPAGRNILLEGDGWADGYDHGDAGTTLEFTGAGVGIDWTQQNWTDPARPYGGVRNICFDGNNSTTAGVKMGGIIGVEHCDFRYFTENGIQASKLVNSMVLRDNSILGCGLAGLVVGADYIDYPNNTRMKIDEMRIRSCGSETLYNGCGALFYQAQGVDWDGGVVEANFGPAIKLWKPADGVDGNGQPRHRVLEDFTFRRLWLEANWRGADGYAFIADGAVDAPSRIIWEGGGISVGGQSKAINAIRLKDSRFQDMGGSGLITLGSNGSNCTNTGFLDIAAGFTIDDNGSGNWRKSFSQIGAGAVIGGEGIPGFPKLTPSLMPDASLTLTPEQVMNVVHEVTPTGNLTWTTPSAADILAMYDNYLDAMSGVLHVMNRTNTIGNKITMLGGAGVSFKGKNILDNGSGVWIVTATSPTTVQFSAFAVDG